ncbi:hypothetical protein BDM02DRAFT_135482 [Thelephora ganbajun]|uniref:Uncharacterized protein n=1 Tax=Thelephora ganbajun TaxID=370292 RepID=A0ACB6ZXJ4_THEGA|nr:hypothetical protein BDM02DRAFT_135482 [Thelephora ganbajun]
MVSREDVVYIPSRSTFVTSVCSISVTFRPSWTSGCQGSQGSRMLNPRTSRGIDPDVDDPTQRHVVISQPIDEPSPVTLVGCHGGSVVLVEDSRLPSRNSLILESGRWVFPSLVFSTIILVPHLCPSSAKLHKTDLAWRKLSGQTGAYLARHPLASLVLMYDQKKKRPGS